MPVLTIRVHTTGVDEINKKWKLFRKMPKVIYPEVDKIGSAITRIARIFAPKFTHALEARIRYEVEVGEKKDSLKIISDAPWAHFQEYGFMPHFVKITPYVKSWLDYYKTGLEGHKPGKKGYIFVKKFTPHIKPAIEEVRPNIDTILKDGVDDFLEKNFGGTYR